MWGKYVFTFQLTEADNELYKNFNITISERWQNEIADTIFEVVNQDADKAESKKRAKHRAKLNVDEKGDLSCKNHWLRLNAVKCYAKVTTKLLSALDSDVIVHGYIKKLGGPFTSAWQTRYGKLYPSRLELYPESLSGKPEVTLSCFSLVHFRIHASEPNTKPIVPASIYGSDRRRCNRITKRQRRELNCCEAERGLERDKGYPH